MRIRPAAHDDVPGWLELRAALWPDGGAYHHQEIQAYLAGASSPGICFLAESHSDGLVGFAEVGLRGYAEGCVSSPVGFLEGIYVRPSHRKEGVGRLLVEAGERWAIEQGCTEMASDRVLENEPSGAFHEALGFDEEVRIVCYRKSLGLPSGRP